MGIYAIRMKIKVNMKDLDAEDLGTWLKIYEHFSDWEPSRTSLT